MKCIALFAYILGGSLLLCSLCSPGLSFCEDQTVNQPRAYHPQLCLGYNPELKLWAWESKRTIYLRYCPNNYAYFGLARASGEQRSGERVSAAGDCCKLPAEDILTDDHVFAATSCPPDYVATGGTFAQWYITGSASSFWCTKINLKRYQLGAPHQGIMWGTASQASFPFRESKHILKRKIPLGIRYGIGRETRTQWRESGCIGVPSGSLPVAKLGQGCKNTVFRELQYRGEGEDPPQGTAVTMFPDCKEISDIFDSEGTCTR